jgi:hypothetical protein
MVKVGGWREGGDHPRSLASTAMAAVACAAAVDDGLRTSFGPSQVDGMTRKILFIRSVLHLSVLIPGLFQGAQAFPIVSFCMLTDLPRVGRRLSEWVTNSSVLSLLTTTTTFALRHHDVPSLAYPPHHRQSWSVSRTRRSHRAIDSLPLTFATAPSSSSSRRPVFSLPSKRLHPAETAALMKRQISATSMPAVCNFVCSDFSNAIQVNWSVFLTRLAASYPTSRH